MVMNWQRDPRWINITIGTSDGTIGEYGCTISVIGNIIGVDPTVVNDRLKAVNGFANGNWVIWKKIEEAFPGIKINRVWSYNNDDVKANVPNVIVEVPATPIGGPVSHWVQYLGNQQLADPWTGTIRPTSDFPNPTGYCIITGTWTGATNTTTTTEQPSMTDTSQTPRLAGADISYAQANIDWSVFKNNVNFVLAKATEGSNLIDIWFGNNRQQARDANLLRGWYHFARPDLKNSPIDEAKFFISVINGQPLQEGEQILLDYEVQYSGDNVVWAKTWMDLVSVALGVKPIFYSYQSMLTSHDWSPLINEGYPLWIAAPTNNPDDTSYQTDGWKSAILWQWGNQIIPGVTTGPVDSDIFFGTADEFKGYGYKSTIPPLGPSTPVTPPDASGTTVVIPNDTSVVSVAPVAPVNTPDEWNVIASLLGLPAGSTKDAISNAISQLQKQKNDAETIAQNLNQQIPTLTSRSELAEGKVAMLTTQLADEQKLAQNETGQSYKDLFNQLQTDYTIKKSAWEGQFSTDVAVFAQLKRSNIYYLPTNQIFSIWLQRVTGQQKQGVLPPLLPADFTYSKSVPQPPSTT